MNERHILLELTVPTQTSFGVSLDDVKPEDYAREIMMAWAIHQKYICTAVVAEYALFGPELKLRALTEEEPV